MVVVPLRGSRNGGVGVAVAYAAIITITANKTIYKHFNLRKVMSKKKTYDEASVVRSISKKNSVQVNAVEHVVEVVKNSTDIGNGTWGKIDYLCKVHGYVVVFTTKLSKKPTPKKTTDDDTDNTNSKTAKREAKLNMAAMVKSTMRRVKTK